MWLPWDLALWVSGGCAAGWYVLHRRGVPGNDVWLSLCREAALLFAFYAVWRRAGDVTVMSTDDAFVRGRWIWHAERWLHLPNEATLQHWTLHATWLVYFANAYYIVCHVAPLGVFLVWLFVRHRDTFGRWRNQLAFVSLLCMAIQVIPVAPPRFFPEYGFIDTGAVYGPRVYDSSGAAAVGQLAAMPSMHVAWAMLIGIATVSVSRSRWRWLGAAHAFLTVFAVTVTGYHWLADGLVAAAILLAGLWFATTWQHRRDSAELPMRSVEPQACVP